MSSTVSPVRQVSTEYQDGKCKAKSILSPEGFPVRALVKIYPRRVIPIVFLPGIMGTNLRLKKGGAAAWRPPNGKLQGLVEVVRYLGKNAEERKAVLHPDAVEVDEDCPFHVVTKVLAQFIGSNSSEGKDLAKLRGWDELHQESYSFILNTLNDNLHNILEDSGGPTQYWRKYVLEAQGQKSFGAQKIFKPLSAGELKKFASAGYPVHAIGYNWLQSNNESVERVANRLDAIVAFYRDRLGKHCDKVILVTHSMGGLVGRALTRLRVNNQVLGVLHGVMPAIGAPATYKRMRSGFEGVAKVLLGRDAAEATAVLAQSRGPLELLPTAEFIAKLSGGRQHWLRAHFLSDDIKIPGGQKLLGVGDPYTNIYLNQKDWWRLVIADLINPSSAKKQRGGYGNEDFQLFKKNLDLVKIFHESIAGKYHSNTYAFYAADPDQRTWVEVRWKASAPGRDFSTGEIISDDLKGKVKVKFADHTQTLEICGPEGVGDGTVPEASGQAPTPYVTQIFRHEGEAAGHASYEHQFSYNNDFIAGLTLYSIARLALDSGALDEATHA